MLNAIEPQAIRKQQGFSVPGADSGFSSLMDAMAPAAAETVGQATNDGRLASLTHAAITGAGVTASPAGATPYGYSSGLSGLNLPSGGFSAPPSGSVGTNYTSGGFAASSSNAMGGATGLPTDPFLQQNFLLDKMRSTNMEMIALQAEVQTLNREFMTVSNIMKTRHDTETNSIRNMRA